MGFGSTQKEAGYGLRKGAKPMTRRTFSPEFKRKVVEEHLKGGKRISELEGALGRTSMELDFMRRAFKRAGLPFPSAPRP